jgi:hypothetical protein
VRVVLKPVAQASGVEWEDRQTDVSSTSRICAVQHAIAYPSLVSALSSHTVLFRFVPNRKSTLVLSYLFIQSLVTTTKLFSLDLGVSDIHQIISTHFQFSLVHFKEYSMQSPNELLYVYSSDIS